MTPEARAYFSFREELTLQNGVVFKGERLVIPSSMREELKMKLHASHLGIQACLRRAREAFYWPNMNKDIEEFIGKCSVCNSYRQQQQKEPMIAHPIPSRPWEYIASDLLEFEGRDYLITTDYYSNFFEVDRLYSKTSREVVNKLKAHMARHGIPDKLMSDNGPQCTTEMNSEGSQTFMNLSM